MILKLKSPVAIEDSHAHASALVAKLRGLLESGVRAEPDLRRVGCYQIEDSTGAYYIYVSRVSGSVVLLATGFREAAAASIPHPSIAVKASFGPLALV